MEIIMYISSGSWIWIRYSLVILVLMIVVLIPRGIVDLIAMIVLINCYLVDHLRLC